jgi:hypothetical protein
VVSGNTAKTAPEIFSATNQQVFADYSAILNYSNIQGNFSNMVSFATHKELGLSSFANYGGYTKTYHPRVPTEPELLPYIDPEEEAPIFLEVLSPLVDFVISTEYPDAKTDQRGVPRPFSPNNKVYLDVGAVEIYGESQVQVQSSMTLQFTEPVDLALFKNQSSIRLDRSDEVANGVDEAYIVETGATGTNGKITLSPAAGKASSVTLTFSDATASTPAPGLEHGSLIDGFWKLSVRIANFRTQRFDIHRYFGDSDGDRDVDATDQAAFAAAQSVYNSAFDFNADSKIDSTDASAFAIRLGTNL